MKTLIFGYPGTGKTTELMNTLDELFKKGISPTKICFCSYTKSAASEAIERAINKFNLKKEDMIYFGTIHSLCFRRFCLNKSVISQTQINEFFKLKNLEYEPILNDEDLLVSETFGEEVGNKLLNFYNLLRITKCKTISEIKDDNELKKIFTELNINEENFVPIFVNVFSPFKIISDYEKFKSDNNSIDFVDMLFTALKENWNVPTDILIVDEAQDLSPLQWKIYDFWKQNKKQVFIAGDDDQSIYGFNGASPERLIKEKETADKVKILSTTWRLNQEIHDYCLNYINTYINPKNRVVKEVVAIKKGGEIIEEFIDGELGRVKEFIRENKKTFILFRTNNFKRQFISEVLLPSGLIYYEIRGQSLWNHKTVNLFNAILKLCNNKSLNIIEVGYLIESISGKFKLLKRGLKSNWKKLLKRNEYNISNLIELGFDMKIFNYLKGDEILNILNVNDNVKIAFMNAKKEEIILPPKIYIGTIHSSKGKEADDVIIFKDITKKIAREVTKNSSSWENEIRVFHVAQTRTKERLTILRGGFDYCESNLIP